MEAMAHLVRWFVMIYFCKQIWNFQFDISEVTRGYYGSMNSHVLSCLCLRSCHCCRRRGGAKGSLPGALWCRFAGWAQGKARDLPWLRSPSGGFNRKISYIWYPLVIWHSRGKWPFIVDLPIKTSIYKGFSMAMLNNQRVDFPFPWLPKGKSERETGACSFAHILLRHKLRHTWYRYSQLKKGLSHPRHQNDPSG